MRERSWARMGRKKHLGRQSNGASLREEIGCTRKRKEVLGPESTEPGRERSDQVGDRPRAHPLGPCRPVGGTCLCSQCNERSLEGVKHMNAVLSFKF